MKLLIFLVDDEPAVPPALPARLQRALASWCVR
jgi:hypothetical protein